MNIEINKDYLIVKSEKLSAAVHILTGHLSKREPMREDLRRVSLSIVRLVIEICTTHTVEITGGDSSELMRELARLVSLLYVAKQATVLSLQNILVLEREYEAIGKAFLMPSLTAIQGGEAIRKKYIRHSGNTPQISSSKNVLSSSNSINNEQTEVPRIEQVLNIIEGTESYSLGDISKVVTGVSEKTIQRDLLKLVADGVLKKTGERRWSRYSRV